MRPVNNLHISLTEMRFESRVLKETASIASLDNIDHVFIVSLGADDIAEQESPTESITINRIRLKSRGWSKNVAVQIFKYLEFCTRVAVRYRSSNVGMINVHVVGLLPLGVLLKWFYRAKLVYDTHELETEIHGLRGSRQSVAKRMERWLIPYVDQIVVVSENIADWYAATYRIRRPTVVLNAPRTVALPASCRLRDALAIRNNQTIALYQGIFAPGRQIEGLLAAFEAQPDDKTVIVFMGYGPLEHDVRKAAARSANIFLHPAVPPTVLLEYTASADIGIVGVADTCLSFRYSMPNKLFEYAMAGLPVIVPELKEMQEFVHRYCMGVVKTIDTPVALDTALAELGAMSAQQMRLNSRRAAEENSWEVQERKLLNAYRDMNLGVG